jgi:hypothetical protein
LKIFFNTPEPVKWKAHVSFMEKVVINWTNSIDIKQHGITEVNFLREDRSGSCCKNIHEKKTTQLEIIKISNFIIWK